MKINNVINKEDYENYKIQMPVNYLFSKKKNKFIYGELEKVHPCFSDDFCFFPKNKISHKGVISDVIVIYKSKLAEYKNKTGLNNFKLEDLSKRKIRIGKSKYVLIGFIILAVIILLFCIVNYEKEKKIKQENLVNENIELDNGEKEFMKDFAFYDKKNLNTFFNIIRNNKGILNNLNWNLNLKGENLLCSVENIYPELVEEKFPACIISDIAYKERIPVFDFTISNNFSFDLENSNNKTISSEFKKGIRNLLINNNSIIEKETSFPYEISFNSYINMQQRENNIFLKLSNFLNKESTYIQSISINHNTTTNGYNLLKVKILFSNNYLYKNNTMEDIGKNIDLWFSEEIKNINNNNIKKSINDKLPSISSVEDFKNKNEIIGEIKYNNGRKIIFYKNEKGKIDKKEFLNGA